MIVTRHIGQTGNSLFQIANSIGYATKYGYQWGVDPSSGHGEPYSKIHEWFPNLPKADMAGIRFHEHKNEFCAQHNQHKDICHYDYHDIPNMGPNVVFSGFYQSWKYFAHCEAEVRNAFKLNYVAGYEDYVSIHVRRGDYLQHQQSFPPITLEYIGMACNVLDELIFHKKILVFSDDIAWCKNHIVDDAYQIEFSEGHTAFQDFTLMASCGHHIVANSTFSWWAAYLGQNPDRKVICPSAKRGNWYGMGAGVKKDVNDLPLPHWTQIEFR